MIATRLMPRLLLVAGLTFFADVQGRTHAPTEALEVARSLFPDQKYEEWTSTTGDLNGDGLDDVALVITGGTADGPRSERLVVLFGTSNGTYTAISASGEFCQVRYHYNLHIKGSSLFVEGFSSVSGSNTSMFRLQFRYGSTIGDLELIGREDLREDIDRNAYYRVSVNYPRGLAIHARKAAKRYMEKRAAIAVSPSARLNGFDCLNYHFDDGNLYIREDFSVKRW
jgi:hypothetical protein